MAHIIFYIFFILGILIVWVGLSFLLISLMKSRNLEIQIIADIKKDIEIIKEEFRKML